MFRVVLWSLGTSVTTPCHGGCPTPPMTPPSDAIVSFFDNLLKKLDKTAQVLRKNIWFSVPIPKIKFDPPPQGKIALVFIF